MARVDIKPAAIVEAIRLRLINAGAVAHQANCFIAQPDQAFQAPPGDTWLTLWIDGGQFDPEQADGGVATVKASVTVVAWSKVLLDPTGKDAKTLTDATRGLLVVADKVFQALWLHDLQSGADEILSEPMRPVTLGSPVRPPDEPGSVSLTWEVIFNWEVSED